MKKKTLYITSLVFILLAAASTWSYYCLNPSSDRVNKAKANIKVYSHYELIQNGKTILRFDEDTTTLAANFAPPEGFLSAGRLSGRVCGGKAGIVV